MSDSLQSLHRRAVSAYQDGTKSRWVACLASSRIVGNYQRGATLALAQDLALSVSQIENLAVAGSTYRRLRRYPGVKEARQVLTVYHFVVVGEAMERYGVQDVTGATLLIETAKERATASQLRDYLVGEYGKDIPAWVRRGGVIGKQLEKWINDYGIPEELRIGAGVLLGKLKEYLEK